MVLNRDKVRKNAPKICKSINSLPFENLKYNRHSGHTSDFQTVLNFQGSAGTFNAIPLGGGNYGLPLAGLRLGDAVRGTIGI